MIQNKKFFILILLASLSGKLLAQDLMDMLKDETPQTNYAYATFKTTRIVLGQENAATGVLSVLMVTVSE